MKKLDVIDNKIISVQHLPSKLSYWRFLGKKVVFTNGCFDIVHLGHIDYLSKAADLGDVLLVGLNTDQSVKRIKGSGRPINDESARAKLLASMFFVSGVVMFDEDTPYELISVVKPDVLVKGSDYKAEDIVGYDIVTKHGGKVITLDFLPGYSTTAIVKKLTKP
jgi:D-glycero-beta-D-manno-heptose 1-phosphate adenylyltransferase